MSTPTTPEELFEELSDVERNRIIQQAELLIDRGYVDHDDYYKLAIEIFTKRMRSS